VKDAVNTSGYADQSEKPTELLACGFLHACSTNNMPLSHVAQHLLDISNHVRTDEMIFKSRVFY
jgi:hypothetical protein